MTPEMTDALRFLAVEKGSETAVPRGRRPAEFFKEAPLQADPMDKFEVYLPVLIMAVVATALAVILMGVSALIGKRTRSRVKMQPYECGVDPVGDTKHPVPVKYYLVAILFIIFDIEVVFLYPWAVIYDSLGLFGLVEMLVFVAILLTGYFYILGKGALKWD